MVMGLGALAFAGPLSGSWATTIKIDPGASDFNYFFQTLNSALTVDYTISGWTFGAVASFDKAGFSAQSFSAAGVLGAFTFSSNMSFDPMAITVKTYDVSGITTQTPSTSICPLTWTATTYAPRFLKWDATGSVSIAGVDFEAYFLLDRSHYDVTLAGYLTNLSSTQTDAFTCTSYNNGSGWRFKVGGTFGDVSVTSYTYFNLSELDAKTTYCPALGKRGVFSIVGADCDPSFYEEYLLLEGFGFGCASIDAALSIKCTGFNYAKFLVSDISIGGWLDLDFGINFGLTSKTVDLCMALDGFAVDCLTIELAIGNPVYDTGYTIDSLYVHGVGFTYTWNGISFSSYTELDAYSALFSASTAWTYLNGDTQNTYMVPYVGKKSDCTTYFTLADAWYEAKCVATERFKLWEKFVVDIAADSCCGGLLDITVGTFFGDHEVLSWYGYGAYAAGSTSATTHELYDKDGDVTYAFAARTTTTRDAVSTHVAYEAGTTTTLFDWAKTETDLSIGVGSNVTLTLGFDISAFGWEDLEFGFTFAF